MHDTHDLFNVPHMTNCALSPPHMLLWLCMGAIRDPSERAVALFFYLHAGGCGGAGQEGTGPQTLP